MIPATQLRVGNIMKMDNALFRVLKVTHITPGKGNAQIQAEARNIRTGIKNNMRFRPAESIELVDADTKEITFLYQEGTTYHFMDPATYEQLELPESFLEDILRYLKPESMVTLLSCDGENISVALPVRMTYTVVECDPASKGISGATKDAKVDNGAVFKVPLFIKQGDLIVINTEDSEYFEKG